MANQRTGDIYTPEMMETIRSMARAQSSLEDVISSLQSKDIVEITDEEYKTMQPMNKEQRISYLAARSCPCGSGKRRDRCCGVG